MLCESSAGHSLEATRTVERVHGLEEAREVRLLNVRTGLPPILWAALIILGIDTIVFTYFVGMKSSRLHIYWRLQHWREGSHLSSSRSANSSTHLARSVRLYGIRLYTSSMNEQAHSEEHSEGPPTPKQLKDLYRGARDPVLRAHLHIVWRLSLGEPLGRVAQLSGYSTKWVKEILRRYEEGGVQGLGDRRHHNPGGAERALLDAEQREELMAVVANTKKLMSSSS
jgi:hypothetical protein